jgi:phosphatidylglycerophosphate synthase
VHAGDITVRLVRSVSIYITWLLIPTGITGNGVSTINVLVGLASGAAMAFGRPWGYLAGFLLLVLNAVLDGVDGEMARYRSQSSLTGLFIDRINSIFVFPAILLGAGVGLFQQYDRVWLLYAAFFAAFAFNALRLVKTSIDTTLVEALTLAKARQEDRGRVAEADVPFSEHLRSQKKLHLTVIDLFLVRQIGFVMACLAGVVGHAALEWTRGLPAIWWSPAVWFVCGYALLLLLALPAAIVVVVRSRRVEGSFAHLMKRLERADSGKPGPAQP